MEAGGGEPAAGWSRAGPMQPSGTPGAFGAVGFFARDPDNARARPVFNRIVVELASRRPAGGCQTESPRGPPAEATAARVQTPSDAGGTASPGGSGPTEIPSWPSVSPD